MLAELISLWKPSEFSLDEWVLLAAAFSAINFAFIGLIKSAPIRDSFKKAAESAVRRLKDDGELREVKINTGLDLQRIPLSEDTTAESWAKSANRYIAFIDRTNGSLVRIIFGDFLVFVFGTWVFATIASASLLEFVERSNGHEAQIDVVSYIVGMNKNSIAQYFNQPYVDVDPIVNSNVDTLITFPYAWILGIIGIPSIFVFGLKLAFNRRGKWHNTRNMLQRLVDMDPVDRQRELDQIRAGNNAKKKPKYYKAWLMARHELENVDAYFTEASLRELAKEK